jgi:hypothetical protein
MLAKKQQSVKQINTVETQCLQGSLPENWIRFDALSRLPVL